MKLKDILLEITGSPEDTFQMYHGGKRWSRIPTELQASGKGRYEGGVGIYFTNNYDTARRYAKGSRVVHLANIDKNYKSIDNVRVPLKELLEFVKNVSGMKKKHSISEDIIRYSVRVGREDVPLSVLNNLVINYEVGSGNAGLQISNYFVSKGVDAYLDRHSGEEFWLVVFNPRIIKTVRVIDPKEVKSGFPFLISVKKS